jgi:hypothetical protein
VSERSTCRAVGATARSLAVDEVLIYREEVTAIVGALSDIVFVLNEIKELLIDGEEEADDEEEW